MLQQTQVERVCAKYTSFLKRFPSLKALARASRASVLRQWQGLGYNRRALNLHKAAQEIVHKQAEKFPHSSRELEALPGVGPYTARAMCVFAWNKPEVFMETNIRRVFLHFFFADKKGVLDKELFPIIKKTLYTKNPRLWYWALMDYGAGALKNIPNPNRRSQHYARQSKFEGSHRYARAKILTAILGGRNGKSMRELRSLQQKDRHLEKYHLTEILQELQKEHFIERKKTRWVACR